MHHHGIELPGIRHGRQEPCRVASGELHDVGPEACCSGQSHKEKVDLVPESVAAVQHILDTLVGGRKVLQRPRPLAEVADFLDSCIEPAQTRFGRIVRGCELDRCTLDVFVLADELVQFLGPGAC